MGIKWGWAAVGLGAAVGAVGYAASLHLNLRHENVAFKGVKMGGLRILHISDLHSRYADRVHCDIWRSVLGLEFDLVAITGDIVQRRAEQLEPHMPGLRALARRAPVFYVDGNHERTCYEEVAYTLRSIGVMVLDNWKKEFERFTVYGFRDFEYIMEESSVGVRELLLDIARDEKFKVILVHQPQMLDYILPYVRGSALVLAGHTHGGQVRLPWLPTLFAPNQGVLPRYGDGWYGAGDVRMFVSRGVGATVFPLRLFNASEVALHKIK
ncbi:MAG: metallophosphoesterase [Turicibacter sp.]|nr:metallophosphoesterase [Turicibacter sp.]